LEPGELVLGDLKTGQKLDFSLPGYCVQMALYATGQLYDLVANRRLPTPPINQHWTLLVHLPFGGGKCQLLWCPISTGLMGAAHAYDVKQWRKEWKRGSEGYDAIEVPLPSPEVIEEAIESQEEVDLMVEMTAYAKARVHAIAQHPEAKHWLGTHWDISLPSPKQGYQTAEQLVAALDLLDECEKKFSLPFLRDPRSTEGQHKSQLDRSNERGLVES
jgi:hypothetical protein